MKNKSLKYIIGTAILAVTAGLMITGTSVKADDELVYCVGSVSKVYVTDL